MLLNERGSRLAEIIIGTTFLSFLTTIIYLVADSVLAVFTLLYI